MRRLLAALAVVAAVSVTVWIRDRAPHPEDWQRPFLRHGEVGRPVAAAGLQLTVEGVDGGRGLIIGTSEPRPTGGVWLVVPIAIETDREPAAIGSVELVDDRGRHFAPASSYRFNQTILDTPVQPGTVARGAIAFEVPFDVGDRVFLRAGAKDPRLDAVTDIALPIPADAWTAWATAGSEVTLPNRTVEAA